MIVSKSHPNILLVSSAPVVRAVLKEALEHAEYNVMAVSGLGGAVDRIERLVPDLLIIRPYLNNIAGHDAAVYLRTKAPGMRVLIVSGMIDDDRLLRPEQLESFDTFPKPYTVEEFLEKVKQVLEKPV